MKLKINVVIDLVCLLYILLFVYAATSKLIDFESFQVQLGQSPLLSSFAGYLSYGIPLLEIGIALLLIFKSTRLIALFASFSLMGLFTSYIIFILNFASYIPCSCGGILEKMGWHSHLIFNIVFMILSVIAILMIKGDKQLITGFLKTKRTSDSLTNLTFKKKYRNAFFLGSLMLFSVFAIYLLFYLSEHITHQNNNFIRRFPPHPTTRIYEKDLKFNSFYFAGAVSNKVYLGNTTTPLHILTLDSTLQKQNRFTIQLDQYELPFRSVQVRVLEQNFYVVDGTVSCIFKGKISNWKAYLKMKDKNYFSLPTVVDSATIAMRTINKLTGENILGTIKFRDSISYQYSANLLQKQIDGVFDTDGILMYNPDLQKMIYVYYYRNQYIVADKNLNLHFRGNTIDTTSQAKLDIVYLDKHQQSKLAAPPLIVNSFSTVYNNLLFIKSDIRGKFEPAAVWDKASIIDVYDLTDKSYRFSFYIYSIDGHKVNEFIVQNRYLYALIDKHIVVYKLNKLFD